MRLHAKCSFSLGCVSVGHLKSEGFAYSSSFAFSLHHLQKLRCPLDKVFVLPALVEPLSAETGGAVAEDESLEAFIELQHAQVKLQRSIFHLKFKSLPCV